VQSDKSIWQWLDASSGSEIRLDESLISLAAAPVAAAVDGISEMPSPNPNDVTELSWI